jgi:hypothetical protein
MSPSLKDILANLAVAQAVTIAPALGDSYAAKSAGTIAGILMMLADDAVGYSDRRVAAVSALSDLFSTGAIGDRALAEDIRLLLGEAGGPDDRLDRMLAAFAQVHAWADAHDPALARRCRDFLADWTARDVLSPPALPGA